MTETEKIGAAPGPGEDDGLDDTLTLPEWQLSVLRHTYPGWRIRPVRQGKGGWWATRLVPPTPQEREAGVVPSLARADAPSLAQALAVQEDLSHRVRWPEEAVGARARRPVTRAFAAEGVAAGEARRWLRLVLDGHPRRDDAVLLLSEAFTNAVVHTRSSRVEVTVLPGEDGIVTVQVADQGSDTFPFACGCARDPLAESGRGVALIRSRATRWGFAEEPAGGVLWFELGPEDPDDPARTEIV
jgi:Anti-sigma regulatory factor (Ser/Thr protein kinase)